MSKSKVVIDTPKTCVDCPFCIYTAEEKKRIGYCNTSDEDYYCKVLDRFMEYDVVDGGIDILGKPSDCPLTPDGTQMEESTDLRCFKNGELQDERILEIGRAHV